MTRSEATITEASTRRTNIPVLLTVILAAAVTAALVLVAGNWSFWMVDFAVYRAGGNAAIHGLSLYDMRVNTVAFSNMPFTYPPFSALVFVPVALLSQTAAQLAWTFVNVVCLGAVLWLSLGMLGISARPRRIAVTAAGMVVATLLTPVLMTDVLGQVNVVVMLLVLLDFSPAIPARWRGLATGVAAGIKLTPLLFIVYLLWTRQWRAAGCAVVAFLATVGLSFLVLPKPAWSYWFGGVLFDTNRTVVSGVLINHSLFGLFGRLAGSTGAPLWSLPIGLVAALLGVAAAARARRQGQELLAVLIVAATSFLVSPVSWDHHAVWVAPALLWLALARWRTGVLLPRVILVFAALWFLIPVNWLSKQYGAAWQFSLPGNVFVTLVGYFAIIALGLVLVPVWLPRLLPVSSDTVTS